MTDTQYILVIIAQAKTIWSGGSNWPLIGLTYTSCFIRLGSRTDRFQGDADLLQTCKMGLERGNSTFTSLSIVGNHTQGWQQCDN